MSDESAPSGDDQTPPDSDSESQDEDRRWGFDEDESGLTTETKIGLGLIVVLLAAFAFVVYRKLDEKNSTVDVAEAAEQSTAEEDDSPAVTLSIGAKQKQPAEEWNAIGSQQSEPTPLGPAGPLRPASERSPSSRQTAARPVAGPINDENPFANPGTTNVRTASASSTTNTLSPGDTNPFSGIDSGQSEPANDQEVPQDLFTSQPASQARTSESQQTTVVNELDDPFFEPVSATQESTEAGAAAAGQSQVTTAAGLEQNAVEAATGSDPFNPFAGESDPSDGNTGQASATVNVAQSATASEDEFSPFDPADTTQATGTAVASNGDEPFDPFEPVETGTGSAAAAQTGAIDIRAQQQGIDDQRGSIEQRQSQPAPVDIGFSPFDDPEPTTAQNIGSANTNPRTDIWGNGSSQSGSQISGQTKVYEVGNGDNYWHISKKAYGTPKYFTALARANKKRIPDPTRMRPGMKVLIPPVAQLIRDNPDLFTSATRTQGQTSSTRQKLPSGFFVGRTGQPMYRVGDRDTLSTISQKHLGRSSRWIQIYELNRKTLKNPNDLQIGTVLTLPRDASRVSVAPSRTSIR